MIKRDFRALLPEATGLTPVNLYYCKRFYLLYTQIFEKFHKLRKNLEGYNQPIAITAYEGIQILPDNFNETLPSIEDLEEELLK